jgi:hypothetical protein
MINRGPGFLAIWLPPPPVRKLGRRHTERGGRRERGEGGGGEPNYRYVRKAWSSISLQFNVALQHLHNGSQSDTLGIYLVKSHPPHPFLYVDGK